MGKGTQISTILIISAILILVAIGVVTATFYTPMHLTVLLPTLTHEQETFLQQGSNDLRFSETQLEKINACTTKLTVKYYHVYGYVNVYNQLDAWIGKVGLQRIKINYWE